MSCSFLKNNFRHIFLMKNNSHGTENVKLPSVLSTFYQSTNTKLFQFHLKGLRFEGQTSSSKYIPMVQYHYPTITISACKKEHTAQKMKFSMKDFFSKYDQICSFLWIWSHLMKKSFLNGKLHFLCSDTFFKNTSLWLLLTGKHLHWSLFLILSIAKCLRAHIQKNIWEQLLL